MTPNRLLCGWGIVEHGRNPGCAVLLLTHHLLAVAALGAAEPPALAISVPCEVIRARDGDSITVRVTLTTNVRLLENWSPELRDPGGIEARDRLRELTAGRKGTLTIPLDGKSRLGQIFSFGRLLAHVQMDGHDKTLSALMVEEGHATTTREGR